MSFTIVSERQGVTSRDSRGTPQDAFLLASALVQNGVEKVWVYDDLGRFVSASALAQIARRSVDTVEPEPSAAPLETADLLASEVDPPLVVHGGDAAPAVPITSDPGLPVRRGARVFRLAPQRS